MIDYDMISLIEDELPISLVLLLGDLGPAEGVRRLLPRSFLVGINAEATEAEVCDAVVQQEPIAFLTADVPHCEWDLVIWTGCECPLEASVILDEIELLPGCAIVVLPYDHYDVFVGRTMWDVEPRAGFLVATRD